MLLALPEKAEVRKAAEVFLKLLYKQHFAYIL